MTRIQIFNMEKFDIEATEDGSKYGDSDIIRDFSDAGISSTRSKTKVNLGALDVIWVESY